MDTTVAPGADEVMEVVLDIVHGRTGYPHDMLEPDLDLEADLSIDSIKRVEIVGALADRVGLLPGGAGADGDSADGSAVEELARIKTLRGIVDWIVAHHPAAARAGTAPAPAAGAGPAAHMPVPRLQRLRVEDVPVGEADARNADEVLRGRRFGIVEDGHGIGLALGELLRSHGAEVTPLTEPGHPLTDEPAAAESHAGPGAGPATAEPDTPAGPAGPAGEPRFDGVVDLGALRHAAEPVLPEVFGGLRRVLTGGVRWLVLVTGTAADPGADPVPGAGIHGFARTAALEYPGTVVRAVDVDPKDHPERVAARLLAELCTPDGPASVTYGPDGARCARQAVPGGTAPLRGELPLDRDAVVLLTGGARGITARTALALARATGCHVELLGRTAPPTGEDPFPHAQDRVALRAALIAHGLRAPAEIEAAASRILAGREVRATLDALARDAASVRYHRADVTDEAAVRAVLADVRARHGRLDGIVHGAGLLRDALLRDKEPASFAEVFATKVGGARHLAAAAAEHGTTPAPRFLALFGSVAGVYGNRGQCDYAAANDALDTLARAWAGGFPGRVFSVDWGPWAAEAGGMVTPELERAYARRGIALIDPDAGTSAFLAELAGGTDVQVVLMAEQGEGDAPDAAAGSAGGGGHHG
ncbi:SDR family NAD(P)-dependent oxidoreductase [Streptomyces sp. WAC06614]|uniref:SDR family NAD(P)-dependent oxidoreductase n=1 Tax=Streptomyces sp. WAC06614 TaxID=2487416 RepID=UPI001C8D12C7|nr:SDR family NAD(P)-dependent oxidoreductase [Streptomyces sp. WAC06614]